MEMEMEMEMEMMTNFLFCVCYVVFGVQRGWVWVRVGGGETAGKEQHRVQQAGGGGGGGERWKLGAVGEEVGRVGGGDFGIRKCIFLSEIFNNHYPPTEALDRTPSLL